MNRDQFRASVAKAYNATEVAQLRALFAEQTKWNRRATIARNKLEAIRSKIDGIAEKLALDKYGIKPEEESKP